MQIIFDNDRERMKFLTELCYGTAQGIKLMDETKPLKAGQHIEAIRLSWLTVLRLLPEEVTAFVITNLENAGFNIDLNAPRNEGGKP